VDGGGGKVLVSAEHIGLELSQNGGDVGGGGQARHDLV